MSRHANCPIGRNSPTQDVGAQLRRAAWLGVTLSSLSAMTLLWLALERHSQSTYALAFVCVLAMLSVASLIPPLLIWRCDSRPHRPLRRSLSLFGLSGF
jgi:hypothetical protein